MSRRAQENIVGVIVLAVFVVMLYLTFGYSSRARLVPLPVCILGIVLARRSAPLAESALGRRTAGQLSRRGRQPRRGQDRGGGAAGSSGPVQPQSTEVVSAQAGGELSAFGIVALLLALVFVVGPLPSVFLFTAGYLALTKHCSLARAILYALACAAMLYGLFGFALGVQLNRGLLSGFLVEFCGLLTSVKTKKK